MTDISCATTLNALGLSARCLGALRSHSMDTRIQRSAQQVLSHLQAVMIPEDDVSSLEADGATE